LLECALQRRTAAHNFTERGLGSVICAVKGFFGENLDRLHVSPSPITTNEMIVIIDQN
jgi:hypothetical protein